MAAAGLACASCGIELRGNARFCDECGAPVTPVNKPAEYKQVTVLFADVVHSMEIAAAVGAERLREIMTELVSRSAAVVQRYGGTVDTEHVGPTLRRAAAEAGRPEGEVQVAASLPIAVTDDVEGLRTQAAEQFALYGQLPSYRAMLDHEGYRDPQDVALVGDEKFVAERIDELRDAGVDEFVGYPFDASADGRARTRKLLRDYAK